MSNQNDKQPSWYDVMVEAVNGLAGRVLALEKSNTQQEIVIAEYEKRIRELERNVDELNTRLYSQGEM